MKIQLATVALLFAAMASQASAQTTASQQFTVSVPAAITITAPSDVSLTHDETENDQAFPEQPWVVSGNVLSGVTATFVTSSAFTHTVDPTAQRDAGLAVSIDPANIVGAANWVVDQASDTTDFANSNGVATVQVSSTGVGQATVGLAVSFVTDGFGTFPAGDYVTTVTGTVTAN